MLYTFISGVDVCETEGGDEHGVDDDPGDHVVCGCDPGLRAACEARGHLVYREETCQCQCRDIQVSKHQMGCITD